MNQAASEQAAISFLMKALADRGWPDQDDLALRLVKAFRSRPELFENQRLLSATVPSSFVARHGLTKAIVVSFLGSLAPTFTAGFGVLGSAGPGPAKPSPLRILYVTANPDAVETVETRPDGTLVETGTWLRTELEVSEVRKAIRRSNLRDRVLLEHLPAATADDLIDGLNDHRPHILHFSGHASSWGLTFEDPSGVDYSQEIEFELFAAICEATDDPPKLIVLNACESLNGAGDLLKVVPALIGMTDTIGDGAAIRFAAAFYSALAAGQSVGTALKQGRLSIRIKGLADWELPQIRMRKGLRPEALHLP